MCSIEYLGVAQLLAGQETRWKLVTTNISLRPHYLFYPLNEYEIAIFGDVYQHTTDTSHKSKQKKQDRAFVLNVISLAIDVIPWEDRSSPELNFKFGSYGQEKNFSDNYTITVKQPDIWSQNQPKMESLVVAIAVTGQGVFRKAKSFGIAKF